MGRTLDKTMGDRKHLKGIELERPIATIKGSQNEKHGRLVRGDRCLVLLMYRYRLACGYALADQGGHKADSGFGAP
jgi:hypothetical protein